jgi:hypothetical protein
MVGGGRADPRDLASNGDHRASKRPTPDYAGLRSQVFALCLLTPTRRASARSFGTSNSFIWKELNGAQGRN